MKSFRFSPIEDQTQLFQAIEYIHLNCHKLCQKNLGYLLPVAGNIGVFCHYEDEFERLLNIRKELTDLNDNWNQKYFRLYKPITFPAQDGIPETTYTYLYIRKPDSDHPEVGDADFYLEPQKYTALKQDLLSGKVMCGVEVFKRPELDLIKLSDPNYDVGSFIGKKTMAENVSA
jgi:hypothetical protein